MTQQPSPPASEIQYPFERDPEPGEAIEVADGLLWIRMPLPFSLDHINVYLLRDGEGWTLVDTGIRAPSVQGHWETIFGRYLDSKPLTRVMATHLHPDHIGLAGWMTRKFDIELWMSRTEFYLLRSLAVDGPRDVPDDAVEFYRRLGFSEDRLEIYRTRFGSFGSLVYPLPAGHRRMRDGQTIEIGGREWRVVVGHGHSPEHVCLHCAELGVLLAGDQVLPRITPNVSVHPTEPYADPLADWLSSCARFIGEIPAETLVLPAHNRPFVGLHPRLRYIIEHHLERCERLHDFCSVPRRAVDVFPALFDREINDLQFFMAAGESHAHINFLEEAGLLIGDQDDQGVVYYRQSGRDFVADELRPSAP